eukprot:5795748-Pleurochrysis_carterae.AAC.1
MTSKTDDALTVYTTFQIDGQHKWTISKPEHSTKPLEPENHKRKSAKIKNLDRKQRNRSRYTNVVGSRVVSTVARPAAAWRWARMRGRARET